MFISKYLYIGMILNSNDKMILFKRSNVFPSKQIVITLNLKLDKFYPHQFILIIKTHRNAGNVS